MTEGDGKFMPFAHSAYYFNASTIETIKTEGGVYGLFAWDPLISKYRCRYVGQSDNLRRRLKEHLNSPPITGITHFFAELWSLEWQRLNRERELIREFNPPGNTIGTY
jgi:hypothetical protein